MKAICASVLIIAVIIGVAYGSEYAPVDEPVMKELEKVEKYYNSKQYGKARTLLDKVRKKYIDNDPDMGMGYSQMVRNSIKSLDGLIADKMGAFNKNFPHFTGIVTEKYTGPYSGYFVVKQGKISRAFLYDAGIIMIPDDGFRKGDRVTVYYNSTALKRSDDSFAEKVVIKKQEAKKTRKSN